MFVKCIPQKLTELNMCAHGSDDAINNRCLVTLLPFALAYFNRKDADENAFQVVIITIIAPVKIEDRFRHQLILINKLAQCSNGIEQVEDLHEKFDTHVELLRSLVLMDILVVSFLRFQFEQSHVIDLDVLFDTRTTAEES